MGREQLTDQVCRVAINLSRNCNFAVFPCRDDKRPTRPEKDGGHGWKDGTTEPDRIAWLWQRCPAR